MEPQKMRPLVGLTCCLRKPGEQAFHMVSDKYVEAAVIGAGALPVLLPALGGSMLDVLDRIDGLLLTGSPSNIEPHHYDGPAPPPDNMIDRARDSTSIPLIQAALERGMPVLGICRGMQELNVALGGSLHQEVHNVPGRHDHRSAKDGSLDHKYRKVHHVTLTPDGVLQRLAEGANTLFVNSLHGQGIDRLATDLSIEALAPDGQIEAVALRGVEAVAAVQWHPEWSVADDSFSRAYFQAFGRSCLDYAQRGRLYQLQTRAAAA